ncbi:MAG: D-alanyl-D-alanine carboxypeptidase family protein [Firmicutes bacterium]|nr:D-alanyl-D-alanine carboxypeptidase family protein [Bacillota bacterium]
MRKKVFMWILALLLMCSVMIIAGCGASEGAAQGNEDNGDVQVSVDPSVDDEDNAVSVDDPVEPPVDEENQLPPEEEDPPADEIVEPPVSTDDPTVQTTVWPGNLNDDPDAPSKGEDHSVRGIPEVIETRVADDGDLLVLVNKYYTVSKDYKPKDLVTIDNKYGTYTDMEMKDVAYEAYKKMYADAKEEGFDLKLCSTMRSYNTQKTLFNNSLKNRGRETTNVRSAYPGRSEHHTGLALDVTSASMGWGLTQDFIDYADGQWINDHCHEYGFIIRYPKGKTDITGYAYEPWHLRYVGIDVATYIMANDLTLEEYLDKVPPQQ